MPRVLSIIVLSLLVGAIFLLYGWLRETRALIHAFDTGLYMEVLNSFMETGIWRSSITGEENFLAHHFQPILIVLVPLFALAPHASVLFGTSLLAAVASAGLIYAEGAGGRAEGARGPNGHEQNRGLLLGALALAVVVHPSVANRMYHSFAPDVLAVPFFLIQGFYLTRRSFADRDRWLFLGAQFAAGMAKEVFWPINAFVALLCALRFRQHRPFFVSVMLVQLAVFAFLFFYWMPAHSTLPSYYGLRYYLGPVEEVSLASVAGALAQNLFSLRSLETLVLDISVPLLLLPFLGRTWAVAAAIPGLVLVLCARDPKVHHVLNHHMLPALSFLWVAAAVNLTRLAQRIPQRFIRPAGLMIVLVPLSITLFDKDGGLVFKHMFMTERPYTRHVREAVTQIRGDLRSEYPFLLVDGNLQPLFYDLDRVRIILGFSGNPAPLTTEDINRATDVVTFVDPTELEACTDLKPGSADKAQFDYETFYRYCQWLKEADKEVVRYERARLYHFKL